MASRWRRCLCEFGAFEAGRGGAGAAEGAAPLPGGGLTGLAGHWCWGRVEKKADPVLCVYLGPGALEAASRCDALAGLRYFEGREQERWRLEKLCSLPQARDGES